MTQPRAVDSPTAQELLDAESLAYEQSAEQQVTAQYAAQVAAAVAVIVAAVAAIQATMGLAAMSSAVLERIRALIVRELFKPVPDMNKLLGRWIMRGSVLGVRQAARREGLTFGAAAVAGLQLEGIGQDESLTDFLAQLDTRARREQDKAALLARTLDLRDESNVTTVIAQASHAVEQAKADVRWLANRAVNAGTAALAERLGMDLVWVAERNACLHCLAYSGLTTSPGQDFPTGLTFADKPINTRPVPYPPLHPNCRCRVRLSGPTDTAPAALRREAERSVARGWSGYASERARLSAADRLVSRAAGTRLPRTVVARARRDVARRRFSQRQAARTTLRA